jgi:hypothetical protein
MPPVLTALIMGSDLSGYRYHTAGGWIQRIYQLLRGNHRQNIHRSGKPGNFQEKSVKAISVVFVGELGKLLQASANRDGVA